MAKKELGEKDYIIEFNDSVLSTKTWNNPRYDGCETKTQELNKFTQGDVTYGKKTAVQKYSRNIYVGQKVLGYLDDLYTDLAHTDPQSPDFNTGKYTGFPDWSYVVLDKVFTVNDDDSLEQARKFETPEVESADGLGREFKSDFIIGTKCNIIDYTDVIDPINGLATKPALQSQYTVQFNKGLLGKIAEAVATKQDFNINVTTPDSGKEPNTFRFNPSDAAFNNNSFFIQDSSSFNQFWHDISGSGFSVTHASQSAQFFQELRNQQVEYNSKYAIKFFSTSSADSLYVSNEFGPESKLLYELSDITVDNTYYVTRAKIKNTGTKAIQTVQGPPSSTHTNFIAEALDNNTNFVLYYLNESNNVIIIDLPRKRDLPGGIEKFIVLPENIHPYIKDNIDYFVNQIGLTESNENFTINPRNRQLS